MGEYSSFNDMIRDDKDNPRPKYTCSEHSTQGGDSQSFQNIGKASSLLLMVFNNNKIVYPLDYSSIHRFHPPQRWLR